MDATTFQKLLSCTSSSIAKRPRRSRAKIRRMAKPTPTLRKRNAHPSRKKRKVSSSQKTGPPSQNESTIRLLTAALKHMDTPTLMEARLVCSAFYQSTQPILEQRLKDGVYRKVNLTGEQLEVYDCIMAGYNVFFTGGAGTGKSMILRTLINELKNCSGGESLKASEWVVTAPTGVAAFNIRGITIHSLAGLQKSKEHPQEIAIRIRANKRLFSIWKQLRLLIVDEISMLEGYLFQSIEHLARLLRDNNQPFGGIQVVLCGDFLQLPPVGDKGVFKDPWYAFEMEAWYNCIDRCFDLKRVLRQSDPFFISMLNEIRVGKLSRPTVTYLTKLSKRDIDPRVYVDGPFLYAKNYKVDVVNGARLAKLKGTEYALQSEETGSNQKLMDECCPVPNLLSLKIGAKVMLRRNVDVSAGLINGAMGYVRAIDRKKRCVRVAFDHGIDYDVRPFSWYARDGGGDVVATRKQYPLVLSWAYSIHKSQSLTIRGSIYIDLSDIFSSGQSYVAISRVTKLEYLNIEGFTPGKIRAKKKVLLYYQHMKSHSRKGIDQTVVRQIYPNGWILGGELVGRIGRPERIIPGPLI